MTEFAFGHNRIRVDVERTRAWYDACGKPAAGCTCGNCRNFIAAASLLPKEVGEVLAPLGLTLLKTAEVMEWCREADGRHWYTLQYHLAGELVEKGEGTVQIAPEVTVGFAEGGGPFLKNFPEPFFQLFLDLRLPWVLDETNNKSKSLLQENAQ
jgi:hypothetical protein